MLLSYYLLVHGNNYLITFCVSFWLYNRWHIENYCTESTDTLWVTCVPTWKSRLVYWPAWACSSVPSLDRVLNTRPRYQGVEMVTSFFKSHQRTLLPRKRCGCGITETEGRRQNFKNRELLYLHSACNSLQLWRIGTNVDKKNNTGNDRKMLTCAQGTFSERMTKHFMPLLHQAQAVCSSEKTSLNMVPGAA